MYTFSNALPAGQPIGYYMNLQFYSTGSHLAEAEGLWKAQKNFSFLENRRQGDHIGMGLLNVGNVREYLLTASASAEMLWNVGNYQPDDGMAHMLAQLFGDGRAGDLASLYNRYLSAYWQQKGSTISGFSRQYLFHDLRIREAADRQLDLIRARTRNLNPFNEDRLRIDYVYNGAASDVGAIMLGDLEAYLDFQGASDAIDAYRASVPDELRSFYDDVFVTPAHFMTSASRMLYYVTRSHFKVTSSLADSYCYLKTARQAAVACRTH